MLRACVLHKVPRRFLAFTLFIGVCASLAAAQPPPKAHSTPAPRRIILPPKLIVGAPATLAVLDSQGRLLPNIGVELPEGQKVTTGVTGRALFKAPDQPGTMLAKISGLEVHASANVLAPDDSSRQLGTGVPPGGVHVLSYPHIVTLHDR